MKNITLLKLDKYNESTKYRLVEEGIYIDLKDSDNTNYRIAISYELEEGEDDQYPLEDLLGEFCLHVSDFLELENKIQNQKKIELGGTLAEVQKVKTILGNHVYNRELFSEGENTYYDFVIEEEITNADQRYIFGIISQNVKIGFLSKKEIKSDIQDILVDEGMEEEISIQWINSVINSEFKKLERESKYWNHPTDNEKLEAVFSTIWNDHKIISLHDVGYEISDGETEVIEQEFYLRSTGDFSEGYCFYQRQDVERVIDGGYKNLILSFQKIDNEDDAITIKIGHLI